MPLGQDDAKAAREAKKRRLDKALDAALEDSFPGSDPPSVTQPSPSPKDNEQIKRKT